MAKANDFSVRFKVATNIMPGLTKVQLARGIALRRPHVDDLHIKHDIELFAGIGYVFNRCEPVIDVETHTLRDVARP